MVKRYAFIDVPNTTGTARGCLDFIIDWKNLYVLLTNKKWRCEKVFFYKGYKGETEKEQLINRLGKKMGYDVVTKPTHIHKNRLKDIVINCENCNKGFIYKHKVNGNQKSNCDVELTVDALNILNHGDEAMFFTGDGDFAYLIKDLLVKGITVLIVSRQKKDKNGNFRFSTRLKEIIKEEEKQSSKKIRFIDLKTWKHIIEKK